jgi:hypothetical protein
LHSWHLVVDKDDEEILDDQNSQREARLLEMHGRWPW